MRDLRLGRINNEGEFVTRARAAGVRDQAELTRIKERVLWQPLQYQIWRISLEDGLRVFDVANDTQRVLLAPMLAEKVQRQFEAKRLAPEDARRYVQLIGPHLARSLAGAKRRP
ncbi:MAG TPA: hypothetical protein VJA21_01755 [Verrucomicrobiae bacterium]